MTNNQSFGVKKTMFCKTNITNVISEASLVRRPIFTWIWATWEIDIKQTVDEFICLCYLATRRGLDGIRRGQTYPCNPPILEIDRLFRRPATGYNISKIYVRRPGRADGTSENVREKRVFYMATAQSRVRADGHISATERNFFKRSKVADRGLLGAH